MWSGQPISRPASGNPLVARYSITAVLGIAGLADPKINARFTDLGVTVIPGSPGDFGKLIADETEKWAKVVRFSGRRLRRSLLFQPRLPPPLRRLALRRAGAGEGQ